MAGGNFNPLMLTPELETTLARAAIAVDELENVHEPTITASASTASPGKSPTPTTVGNSIIGLAMSVGADDALRTVKMPDNFIPGTCQVHIHWTKNSDLDRSGRTVLWRVTYTVFDGKTDEVTAGSSTVEFQDTYDDAGTTTRIIYRTDDLDLDLAGTLIQPRYYIRLKVEAVTPTGTALVDPILVNLDVTYLKRVHDLE